MFVFNKFFYKTLLCLVFIPAIECTVKDYLNAKGFSRVPYSGKCVSFAMLISYNPLPLLSLERCSFIAKVKI